MENSGKKKTASGQRKQEAETWFADPGWRQGWRVLPHDSVNKVMMAESFRRHPERWAAAFAFLKSCPFSSLTPGKHPIDGETLFYSVGHYTPRDPAEVKFEIHRRYADIQYVYEGEEAMGMAGHETAREIIPYDAEKDIAFFDVANPSYVTATPGTFLVFFPGELHQPGLLSGAGIPVKKVVIKVLMEEPEQPMAEIPE